LFSSSSSSSDIGWFIIVVVFGGSGIKIGYFFLEKQMERERKIKEKDAVELLNACVSYEVSNLSRISSEEVAHIEGRIKQGRGFYSLVNFQRVAVISVWHPDFQLHDKDNNTTP
jgi:hypothetical protein